jgi:hypothetical protein
MLSRTQFCGVVDGLCGVVDGLCGVVSGLCGVVDAICGATYDLIGSTTPQNTQQVSKSTKSRDASVSKKRRKLILYILGKSAPDISIL